MSEDKGFTVHDRRRVKPDGSSAETKEEQSPAPEAEKTSPEAGGEGPRAAAGQRRLPPVDFTGFVLGLGQMTLIHLGELPEPGTGQTRVDTEQARHTIDILDMLQEKTQGNLTPQEDSLLQELRSDLKLKYVRVVGGKRG
ncbi:MAG: hypothetical protein Kow0092_26500 [Deferrisomatales bacterium]